MILWLYAVLQAAFAQDFVIPGLTGTEFFSVYSDVVSFEASYGISLGVQKWALVAVQSSGKTSLLESWVGFPLGFIHQQTGTRCPVHYVLRKAAKEAFWVEDQEVKKEDIRKKISEHMLKLNETDTFSLTRIYVHIESPEVIDMDFVDLPGIRQKENPKFSEIANIILPYARNPSYRLLIVLDARIDWQSQVDVDVVEELIVSEKIKNPPPRPNYKSKSLLVVNGVNKQIPFLSTVDDANRFFTGFIGHGYADTCFVNLRPGNVDSNADFATLKTYLRKLPDLELEWYSNTKNKFLKEVIGVSQNQWDARIDNAFGVNKLREKVSKLTLASFKNDLPAVLREVKVRREEMNEIVKELTTRIKMDSASSVRNIWYRYVEEWVRHMQSSHSAITTLVKGLHNTFDPLTFAVDYAKEIDEAAFYFSQSECYAPYSTSWPGYLTPEELLSKDHLQGTSLAEHLKEPLSGHASFSRFVRVLTYILLSLPISRPTIGQIETLAGDMQGGMYHTPNIALVVKELTTRSVMQATHSLNWAALHIRFLYERYTKFVREFLLNTYFPGVRDHEGFLNSVDEAYIRLIENCIEKVSNDWTAAIDENIKYMQRDIHTKLIYLISLSAPNAKASSRANPQKAAKLDTLLKATQDLKTLLRKSDFAEGGGFELPSDSSVDGVINSVNQYFTVTMGLLTMQLESKLYLHLVGPMEQHLQTIQREILYNITSRSDEEVMKTINNNREEVTRQYNTHKKELEQLDILLEKLRRLHSMANAADAEKSK